MKSVEFALITVCFNSEKTIIKTIDSVLEQSLKPKEYIIVDGASTDGTIAIAKSYVPKFIDREIDYRIISESDQGMYDALNKGIKLTSSAVIGLVHSDDYLELNALELVNESLVQNPEADIIHGMVRFINNGKTIYLRKKHKNSPFAQMKVLHPATFVKKTVYEEVGLFNLDYKIAADFDFILRADLSKKHFRAIPHTLTTMYSGGLSSNIIKTQREFRKIIISHGCNKILAWLIYFKKVIRLNIMKFLNV